METSEIKIEKTGFYVEQNYRSGISKITVTGKEPEWYPWPPPDPDEPGELTDEFRQDSVLIDDQFHTRTAHFDYRINNEVIKWYWEDEVLIHDDRDRHLYKPSELERFNQLEALFKNDN